MGKTNTKLEFKVKLKTSNFGFKMYLLGSKVYLPEYQLCVYSSWNIYLSSEIKPVVVRSCSIRQKEVDLVILNSQRGNFLPMNCYSFGKHSAPIALRWGVKKHQGIHNVVKSGMEYHFFHFWVTIWRLQYWLTKKGQCIFEQHIANFVASQLWMTLKIRQSKINSRWVAGPIGQTNRWPSVWCSKYYFF